MNGKDVFLGLKYVGADLIEQAEFGAFSEEKHRRPARPLLIAALVALLLMLVGCAVVYVLTMQNMKIEKITESLPVMAENNMEVIGHREAELEVLTLGGLKGSAGYQAAQEWYRFQREYDPNLEKYHALRQEGKLEESPAEFGGMTIYTQEMRDTMEDILGKYHLLPPGEILEFRTLKIMCQALGIDKFQTAQNDVGIQISHGSYKSNGNFYLMMQFSLPVSEDSEISDTWGNFYWCRKDCFTPEYTTIEDTNDWQEWNYTTAGGSDVLIFRSPSDWRGWIVCQREEAQLVLQLQVRRDFMIGSKNEHQYLTDRQIEQIADALDFSIQPKRISQADVDNQPEIPPNAPQNGWNVEPRDVQTDGYIVQIRMGITAPEGVDITHVEAEDTASPYFVINPGNHLEFFTPEAGEKNGYAWSWRPEDDGDGLDNTVNCVMTCNCAMMDGSAPFAEGSVWNLHIEDLTHDYWDSQKKDVVLELLTEGEWNFNIRFGSGNGHYEMRELLKEPMTLPGITTWDYLGNPMWSTAQVSSIEIHPMSVHFLSDQANVDFGYTELVMKDGTVIPLEQTSFDGRSIYEAKDWIDITQADYIRMVDGTIIPAAQ